MFIAALKKNKTLKNKQKCSSDLTSTDFFLQEAPDLPFLWYLLVEALASWKFIPVNHFDVNL